MSLPTGTLTVRASKTDAAPGDPVFLAEARSGKRGRQTGANVGRRLKTAIKRANKKLAAKGIEPINERVSPYSLRRTYASLRFACGDDPVYVAQQGGWKDPTFAIRVYARAVKRREKLAGDYVEAFDAAVEWARIGHKRRN